jgi:hypothetical protein
LRPTKPPTHRTAERKKKGNTVFETILEGLFENFADMCGVDSLQALQFAASVDSVLEELRDKYDFFWPSGEPERRR